MKKINERISYKDGEMSIQASVMHYCYPKKDEGPYELYEVAVFDKAGKRIKDVLFEHFADDSYSDEPVYACVPEALIAEALKDDGYFQDSIDGIFERI